MLNINMLPKQHLAASSHANEVLLGGAAGPGKSFGLRIIALTAAAMIPGIQVYLFRTVLDDLIKNHVEGSRGFRELVPYFKARLHDSKPPKIVFENGSRIYLCSLPHENQLDKYRGPEIHLLLMDELTQFSEKAYRFLRSRVRVVGIKAKPEWQHLLGRIICGTNPGGIGHQWVYNDFVTYGEPFEIKDTSAEDGGMRRQFIPSLLEDNPHMTEDDPTYENRLLGLGGNLAKAMRYGRWDIMEGQYFSMVDPAIHYIEPFKIPNYWTRWRGIDWGFTTHPAACVWQTIADHTGPNYGVTEGSIITYREYYTGDNKDRGTKIYADAFARRVKELSEDETISYSVADPSCLPSGSQVVEGPSILEAFQKHKIFARCADNRRVDGWFQMRTRYQNVLEGRDEGLYHFRTCTHLNRTTLLLQHDDKNPLDVLTTGPDHLPDGNRYGCMSRPYVNIPAVPVPPSTHDDPEDIDQYLASLRSSRNWN